jgi:hypothetical protein
VPGDRILQSTPFAAVEAADPSCRDVAQPGRALAWGARGRQFKSARPDQSFRCCCSRACAHTDISVLNSARDIQICSTNGSEFFWVFSRSPKNGSYFNRCATKAVHNPKTSNNNFPNFRIVPLWNECVLTAGNRAVARQRKRFAQSSGLRNAQNLWRCSRGWRGGPAAIVATIQSALKSKTASSLTMGKTLGPVQLGQPALDFG